MTSKEAESGRGGRLLNEKIKSYSSVCTTNQGTGRPSVVPVTGDTLPLTHDTAGQGRGGPCHVPALPFLLQGHPLAKDPRPLATARKENVH